MRWSHPLTILVSRCGGPSVLRTGKRASAPVPDDAFADTKGFQIADESESYPASVLLGIRAFRESPIQHIIDGRRHPMHENHGPSAVTTFMSYGVFGQSTSSTTLYATFFLTSASVLENLGRQRS
jgi:hypothetical protein